MLPSTSSRTSAAGVRPQGWRPRCGGGQNRAELPARRPGIVGNEGRLSCSELGGRAGRPLRPEQLRSQSRGRRDPRGCPGIIKQLESDGLAFEGAEARRFELLIRRHSPDYSRRSDDSSTSPVLVEQRDGRGIAGRSDREGRRGRRGAPHRGRRQRPRQRARHALRKALGAFYPRLDDVHLVDYKVRILDGEAARRRGLALQSSNSADGDRPWSTMGSDTNIITASASALADSLEYAIWKADALLRRRDERHFTTATGPSEVRREPHSRPVARRPGRTPPCISAAGRSRRACTCRRAVGLAAVADHACAVAQVPARSTRCTGQSTRPSPGRRPGIRAWWPTTSTPSPRAPTGGSIVTVTMPSESGPSATAWMS